jgi:hypothetical protein
VKIKSWRLIILAALILLAAAIFFAARQYYSRKSDKPACAGLSCYDDSDCGSKCHCDLQPGAKLGKCVTR